VIAAAVEDGVYRHGKVEPRYLRALALDRESYDRLHELALAKAARFLRSPKPDCKVPFAAWVAKRGDAHTWSVLKPVIDSLVEMVGKYADGPRS